MRCLKVLLAMIVTVAAAVYVYGNIELQRIINSYELDHSNNNW